MKINTKILEQSSNWLSLFFLLYLSLIASLFLGENSTGGAIIDYTNQKKISKDFSLNFLDTLMNYDKYTTRHSPILIIFLSFFEKLNFSDLLIRFIHLNACLILPIYFFKSLKLVIEDKIIIFFLVSLIFISPTFRTLAVWPDSRILGLAFFTMSIYEYLKFHKKKKFINCIRNIILLSISAYISPNFSLFSIFFFIKYLVFYKNNLKNISLIIILNIVLSLPAFIYLMNLETNFLLKTAATNLDEKSNFIFKNIFNNILLITTIIFFYIFPFYALKIFKFNLNKKLIQNILFSISLFLICLFFFDYKYDYTGGGFFFKTSYIFFENNYLFYLISLISIFIVFNFLNLKLDNYILIILLILSNPQITVYHKYYDPLLLILFFTLSNIKINIEVLKNFKNKVFLYLYFLIFLTLSNLKLYVL